MNNWYLYCKKADFAALSEKFNISPMLARILVNRDINTEEKIRDFLFTDNQKKHDPFLFNDMQKGVQLVADSINNKEKIRIVGDYDVDGVCSAYILKTGIDFLGGICDVRLPHRILDGYGMNSSMAIDAANDGISLILTCDNGVSSLEPVQIAKDNNIKVVITDHHELPEILPPADAIIDAKREDNTYPFRELCGAAVSHKFLQALFKFYNYPEGSKKNLEDLYLFAGIATITDIVPLVGENRFYAKKALEQIKNTDNKGLKALIKIREIDPGNIKCHHIGFVIGPCINSAGRLSDAKFAYNLLDSKTDEEAAKWADQLCQLNETRKSMTLSQTEVAENIINDSQEKNGDIDKVLVVYLEDAHESVAGIIAGKLKDEYARPVLVITNSETGLKGSARSVDSYDITAALKRHAELFTKFGGHTKAAGFSLNCSPDELRYALNNEPKINDIVFEKKTWIDMQLPLEYLTENFITELATLEPFGTGNDKPLFAEKNISFRNVKLFGNNSNVIKLQMSNVTGGSSEGVIFGHGKDLNYLFDRINEINDLTSEGYVFGITYVPGINEFRNNRYIQAVIQDIHYEGKSII